MRFVSRKDWGAKPPKKTPARLSHGALLGMAVHYEAVDSAGVPHDKCDDRLRSVQHFHQDTRGWNDIAYSWVVCRHGYVYEGRGWDVRTAAQGTDPGNGSYHAVCYLDDDKPDTRDVTPEAASALTSVINECRATGRGADVRPHKHFHSTACPGPELTKWVADRGWEATCAPQRPEKAPSTPSKPLSSPAWYKRTLQVQNPLLQGQDVINVQNAVKAQPDGKYGPATAQKVRGWQKLHGLTPDGVVGPKTAKAMSDAHT